MDASAAISILLNRSELKVNSARIFDMDVPYVLDRRYVPDYQLVLIGRGVGQFDVGGLGRQDVCPGTALLFSPRTAHGTAGSIPAPYTEVSIHFTLYVESRTETLQVLSLPPVMQLPDWILYPRLSCLRLRVKPL